MINFFKKKEKKSKSETKSSSCNINRGQQQILLQRQDFVNFALGFSLGIDGYDNISDGKAMRFLRTCGALSTAINIISQELGRIKPILKLPDGTLTLDHEIIEKLNNPNDWSEDWSFFFRSISIPYLVTGSTYIYSSGVVSQPPIELYSLKPQNVNNISGTTDYRPNMFTVYVGDGQGSYKRTKEKSGYRFYDGRLKELWQMMSYSTTASNYKGDSPLLSICLDIKSQIAGRLHNFNLLDQGARPSLAVIFKEQMLQEELEERRNAINEQMTGSGNTGKLTAFAASDMSIEDLSMTNKDMDYASLEKTTEQCIFKRYRIPLPLVSNEASTDNNMAHAVYQLYDFAVLPIADEILSSLSMFLLPRYGLDTKKYKITYNPYEIDAVVQRRIENLIKRKELGIESINELREDMPNREPVSGGDDVLVQSTMIPIGSVKEQDQTMTADEEAQALIDRDNA